MKNIVKEALQLAFCMLGICISVVGAAFIAVQVNTSDVWLTGSSIVIGAVFVLSFIISYLAHKL